MTKTLQEIQEENRKLILETIYACTYEEALEREMKIPFCQVKHKKKQDLDSIRHFNSPDDIELVDYLTSFSLDDLKIIGLPFTLSRVLLALSKQDWWKFAYPLVLGFDGAFCEVWRSDLGTHFSEKFRWNLTKETLEEQTGETQREINKLLTEKSHTSEPNRLAASQFKSDEKEAIFAHSCESKAEDEIKNCENQEKIHKAATDAVSQKPITPWQLNHHQESIWSALADGGKVKWNVKGSRLVIEKPKSIWKDVSELPEYKNSVSDYKSYLVKLINGSMAVATFTYYGENYINPRFQINGDGHCSIISAWCELSDFINAFEQMQKDIQELKNK